MKQDSDGTNPAERLAAEKGKADGGEGRAGEKAKPDAEPDIKPRDEKAGKGPSLSDAIRDQAQEGERPLSKMSTLGKILGGDILYTSAIRQQIWLVVIIASFVVMYITNRYSCQQSMIRIDSLTKSLQEAKYKALSTNSQLTEQTRESHVLERLKQDKDSVLHIATQPPYMVNVPQNQENE